MSVSGSCQIWKSEMPDDLISAANSGQISSCRRRYSSRQPGFSFSLKAIRCIALDPLVWPDPEAGGRASSIPPMARPVNVAAPRLSAGMEARA